MSPNDVFTIDAGTSADLPSDEAPFDVLIHDQGVSVYVNVGNGPVVYDQSNVELHCGHQRPLEVLRSWTESAEAAAKRTDFSPKLSEMTRRHSENMRQTLAQAEAADRASRES